MTAIWWSLLTALIWGIVPLFEKVGLGRVDPVTGVFARTAGVLLGALVCAMWWSPWQALGSINLRSFLLLGLGGFMASFLGQMAFYHALKVGHVSQVTPVAGAYPLVAALLGWVILREPITGTRLAGVILIVAGVLLLRR